MRLRSTALFRLVLSALIGPAAAQDSNDDLENGPDWGFRLQFKTLFPK